MNQNLYIPPRIIYIINKINGDEKMPKTVTGRIVSIGVSNDVEVEMIGGIKKIVYVNLK
jgi:hypothetical protein